MARVRSRAIASGLAWLFLSSLLAAFGVRSAPTDAPAGSGAHFDTLSQKITAQPQNLLAGNELRALCRSQNAFDSCIEFFDRLVNEHPDVDAARYNAALAYVDKMPGLSLLVQAKLSTSSMRHATAVLDRKPNDWLALYIRGLNNLYWPTWYRRALRSVEDLGRCTQLSEALPPAQRKPYMAMSYVALGDAYVKLEQFDKAREAWQRGTQVIGASEQLQVRLDTSTEALPALIEKMRSREAPIDTDLRLAGVTEVSG